MAVAIWSPAAPEPPRQAAGACPAAPALPARLPDSAREKLRKSLEDAREHERHTWRDTPAVNADDTVNVFVEIPRGSSEKWEFDMERNRRELNRRIPESLGGYPTGYGFIPGTIGVDGDPFDGLVVGGRARAGEIVRGHVLGIMHMTDEKGHDAKIVVTAERDPVLRQGLLDAAEKTRIATFFNRYKAEDQDDETFACVSGWGDAEEARKWLYAAIALFRQ